ncbi:hypothetical protein ACHAW5_002151 [Stephanodiscus triporus]|uniref:F-box domain-containing protein n=1 Tax=Stephanodiscus triporus TaxID=2934178 RepID=A0ABD3NCZ2_9STRA
MAIPRDDVVALQETAEYGEFIFAFSRLGEHFVDDVLLRIFEFVDCSSLVRAGAVCHRFRELSTRSAEQRTHRLVDGRILGSAMRTLRAQEQIDGVGPREGCGPFVRIPMLGLPRRVRVSGAGDAEYDGRFSNETILWYMSKEVQDDATREITQIFSFWAKLLVTGDAAPDVCQYPSQTSILSRNGNPAWQNLTSTLGVPAPMVELLDN